MEVNTGIDDTARKEIAEGLSRLLADTFTLYLKTHGYHWNITGPMFPALHSLLEDQYVELWEATDDIAERIRALGHMAPASLTDYSRLASVPDGGDVPEAMEMVKRLAEGHESLIGTARAVMHSAHERNDVATENLVSGRIEYHEKTAWMLRATLA